MLLHDGEHGANSEGRLLMGDGAWLLPRARYGATHPRLFELRYEADVRELEALADSGALSEVFDTITHQVAELVDCRRPAEKLSQSQLAEAARTLLGTRPWAYGSWVFYPWTGRLVHVLPKAEFRELRSSRNRNKITRDEQKKLSELKLGIVGLSVGQATALTLALEGIGGTFRLADFDSIALSNLNRIRAGVHEINVNKNLVTARAIFELDPYARIELFPEGVNPDNMGAFLAANGKLDALFEECDDLAMKVRLREGARALGIPVLMETSDRGMLDVERFDLEPERPIFHGLAGELDAERLRGLDACEKIPVILAMIGDVSARAAASAVDIDATLKTWPQLASAVSLGAAVNTDTVRRLALGQFNGSGRYFVELEQIIKDEDTSRPDSSGESERTTAPARVGRAFDATCALAGPLSSQQLETLVRWATRAPSGGNCQPWSFVYRELTATLDCLHAPERSSPFLDFEQRAGYLALGAAVENLRLAATSLGLPATLDLQATSAAPLVARFCFGGGTLPTTPRDRELASAVELRMTNRKLERRVPLEDDFRDSLVRVCAYNGAVLDWVSDSSAIRAVAEAVAVAERVRMLNPRLHREMMSEVRWSRQEAMHSRDGIDIATLELGVEEAAGLRMLQRPEVVRSLREVGGGEGLKKSVYKAFEAASAIGLIRCSSHGSVSGQLLGGQALQRTWLFATAHGWALHPVTASLYLLARFEEGPRDDFSAEERRELASVRAGLNAHFPARPGSEIMMFRLARVAGAPSARSLRRPLSDVLSVA